MGIETHLTIFLLIPRIKVSIANKKKRSKFEMAKEKVNVESEVKEVINQVSLPVTRDEYTDKKTKETLYEYHVDYKSFISSNDAEEDEEEHPVLSIVIMDINIMYFTKFRKYIYGV